MTLEQAFNLLRQAAQSYRGTYQDHLNLQKALETFQKLMPKDKKEEKQKK